MYNKIVKLTTSPSYHIPVQPEVWFKLVDGNSHDMLLTPTKDWSAGQLAVELNRLLGFGHDIAYLQGVVAIKMNLRELIFVALPHSEWAKKNPQDLSELANLFNVSGTPVIPDKIALKQVSMNRKVMVA